jgi:Thiol:disulfide interchange protein DsbD, N-terminal
MMNLSIWESRLVGVDKVHTDSINRKHDSHFPAGSIRPFSSTMFFDENARCRRLLQGGLEMRRFIWLNIVLVLCTAVANSGQFAKSDSKVKASATATKPDKDGKQNVTITLEIAKGWYIYANPTNHNEAAELVAVNRTSVTFKSKDKVEANVKYPAGKVKSEAIGKEIGRWNIYQDKVEIVAEIRRPADGSAVEAVIEVNACHINEKGMTGTCLQQGKITLKIP